MTEEIIIERGCNYCNENDKDTCYLVQLKRLEQENKELKDNLKSQQMINLKQQEIALDYWNALEEIREDMEQDTTCESRECGCDDYAECLNCIKETILNRINEV